MSEINTKIFKPQKWVLDVLNSPKGETIEFEINGNTQSFIKISDKVPEDMGKEIFFYAYNMDEVALFSDIFTEISPSVYAINGVIILTNNIDNKSKGIYINEIYMKFLLEEFGATEFYLIFQTTQDFSISKKTIEGEVHPIEEKYIPGGEGGSTIIYMKQDNSNAWHLYKDKEMTIEFTGDEIEEINNTLINNPIENVKVCIELPKYLNAGICNSFMDMEIMILYFTGIWVDNDDDSNKQSVFSNSYLSGVSGNSGYITNIHVSLSSNGFYVSYYNTKKENCYE